LPFIAYATKRALFFIADNLLVKHFESAVTQNCVGAFPQSWKTALPDSAIPGWPSKVQTQIVAGLTTSIMSYLVLCTKSLPKVRQPMAKYTLFIAC